MNPGHIVQALTLWAALMNLKIIIYMIGAAVVFYGLSVLLTMLFAKSLYPPNAARLGCWLGLLFWISFVFFGMFQFGLFGLIVHVLFFPWELIAVLAAVLLFGILLLVTAKRPAR